MGSGSGSGWRARCWVSEQGEREEVLWERQQVPEDAPSSRKPWSVLWVHSKFEMVLWTDLAEWCGASGHLGMKAPSYLVVTCRVRGRWGPSSGFMQGRSVLSSRWPGPVSSCSAQQIWAPLRLPGVRLAWEHALDPQGGWGHERGWQGVTGRGLRCGRHASCLHSALLLAPDRSASDHHLSR